MTDLKMPRYDGFSVLARIKDNPQWKVIPVLVLSGSEDLDDIKRSYARGQVVISKSQQTIQSFAGF
jgi:CheY-like chemotaxis protein